MLIHAADSAEQLRTRSITMTKPAIMKPLDRVVRTTNLQNHRSSR